MAYTRKKASDSAPEKDPVTITEKPKEPEHPFKVGDVFKFYAEPIVYVVTVITDKHVKLSQCPLGQEHTVPFKVHAARAKELPIEQMSLRITEGTYFLAGNISHKWQ